MIISDPDSVERPASKTSETLRSPWLGTAGGIKISFDKQRLINVRE